MAITNLWVQRHTMQSLAPKAKRRRKHVDGRCESGLPDESQSARVVHRSKEAPQRQAENPLSYCLGEAKLGEDD